MTAAFMGERLSITNGVPAKMLDKPGPTLYRLTLYRARTHSMITRKQTKAAQTPPESFLPLTPAVFHILIALGDGEAHGYAIMQEVAEKSGGAVRLGPGTLYGAVNRLLKDGLIEESEERPDPQMDDTRRRYYRLTDFGERVLAAETKRMADLVRAARSTTAVRKMRPA
ncbi:MAG TPA: PadR family transcriptional regulator [Terriglobia bacterium]|nr:PadR family transcriptional regulator [Terriglobia bacterium]